MSKKARFASALFVGAAVFVSVGEPALAARAKKEIDGKRAECAREATLYIGELKGWWMRRCMAGEGRSPGKPEAGPPSVRPSGPTGTPTTVTPLGAANPPSTSTGSTAPSTAPVAPSAPAVGSSGTSTSGSSATSTSGSSNTSIGGSSGASSSGGGR
jgi:hypothetical protein